MTIINTVKKIIPYIKEATGYVLCRISSQGVEMDDGSVLEDKITEIVNSVDETNILLENTPYTTAVEESIYKLPIHTINDNEISETSTWSSKKIEESFGIKNVSLGNLNSPDLEQFKNGECNIKNFNDELQFVYFSFEESDMGASGLSNASFTIENESYLGAGMCTIPISIPFIYKNRNGEQFLSDNYAELRGDTIFFPSLPGFGPMSEDNPAVFYGSFIIVKS